mmetsp:Transcript_33/g.102  ORF Transcript_33/g.102 Transcript_33/m.102 type:complete len:218 (+) Transcript_33:488-1141(+)
MGRGAAASRSRSAGNASRGNRSGTSAPFTATSSSPGSMACSHVSSTRPTRSRFRGSTLTSSRVNPSSACRNVSANFRRPSGGGTETARGSRRVSRRVGARGARPSRDRAASRLVSTFVSPPLASSSGLASAFASGVASRFASIFASVFASRFASVFASVFAARGLAARGLAARGIGSSLGSSSKRTYCASIARRHRARAEVDRSRKVVAAFRKTTVS